LLSADVLDKALTALVDVRDELATLLGRRLVGFLVQEDLREADDRVEGRIEVVALVVDDPELRLKVALRLAERRRRILILTPGREFGAQAVELRLHRPLFCLQACDGLAR